MLPFLQPKRMATVISAKRSRPDVELAPEVEGSEEGAIPGLRAAMEDLLAAMESKSAIDMARAFHDAFEACEESPHEEGPHVEEST